MCTPAGGFGAGVPVSQRWKNAEILVVTLFVSNWTPTFGNEHIHLLVKIGFLLHISPVEKYLSQCDLVKFAEGDVEQAVGFCEWHVSRDLIHAVIYDTSGELLKPESEKTAEWKRAMDKFYAPDVLAASTG